MSVSVIRQRMARWLGFSHDGRRDLYDVFGWPRDILFEDLMAMYLRNGVANRIVRAFPSATWRDPPIIRDEAGSALNEDDQNFSAFARAADELFERRRIWRHLDRADRLASIGNYGVLLVGVRDGAPLTQPLEAGNYPLLYLSAYTQQNAQVSAWETDVTSPRFGCPKTYTLTGGSVVGGRQASARAALNVHWSRVIHIAEVLDEDETYGTPRLLPPFNFLRDLEKVVGSGAEAFWYNARGGMALQAESDANFSDAALADMKKQAEEFEHQLRRIMALQGTTANMLTTNIADPSPNIERLLDLISGSVGMPKRLLVGSERGELASSQDENNWSDRISERREIFAGPMVLRPLVDMLILTGNLPVPQGQWWPEWPQQAMSPDKASEIGMRRAQTLAVYANSPTAQIVVPPAEFREEMLGLPPESEAEPDDEDYLGDLDEDDEEVVIAENLRRSRLTDNAAPRTLFVSRRVLNAKQILDHYVAQGVTVTQPAENLHVTIAFSRREVDWMAAGADHSPDEIEIGEGGPRVNDLFGQEFPKRVLVLLFASAPLCWRHEEIRRLTGASWDWPDYQPHITITTDLTQSMPLERMRNVEPWRGPIRLGPEIFEEILSDEELAAVRSEAAE